MAHEGVPLIVIQRQLSHSSPGTPRSTSQGIDNADITDTVHRRNAPDGPSQRVAATLTEPDSEAERLSRSAGAPRSAPTRPESRPYGLGVVFDPQRARNGITLTSQAFALRSITSESTPSPELPSLNGAPREATTRSSRIPMEERHVRGRITPIAGSLETTL